MAGFDLDLNGETATLHLRGRFTTGAAETLNRSLGQLRDDIKNATHVIFDFADAERVETNCAFLFLNAAQALREHNVKSEFVKLTPAQQALFKALSVPSEGVKIAETVVKRPKLERIIEILGRGAIKLGKDTAEIVTFFGAVMISLARVLTNPDKLRYLSIITHVERAGLKAAPIVCLMSLLIGGIVAQQGAFQLKRFGADIYVVNMVGVLVLRELGVLLAAIMFAGRSGSAYTAEIGSMKMREEIDAMRVMGLDPIEVLAVPRLLALMISLPLVTILSNLSALLGGLLVCKFYLGIEPIAYITQIHSMVDISHAFIGILKAPFMAVIIGTIACIEGLRVQGSTESLGAQTTTSVVKSIFMVIVVDGIFAIIFTAMDI